MARFGNVVLMRGFLNDDQHREFMQNAAKEYPTICERIDRRIHKICELIQSFDPLRLLQCGYFNYFMSHADKTSEIEIDSETSTALSKGRGFYLYTSSYADFPATFFLSYPLMKPAENKQNV